jgi:hypothetical protein
MKAGCGCDFWAPKALLMRLCLRLGLYKLHDRIHGGVFVGGIR